MTRAPARELSAGPMPAAPNAAIAVNTWALQSPVTGVQRYLLELLPHLPGPVQRVRPSHPLHGWRGLAWEQCVLPARTRGRLLWSPCSTGPLALRAQVVTVHDVAPLDHPEWLTAKFAAWYRFLLPRLARRARHLIAISEFTKRRLVATTGVNPAKVTVILHGIDARFSPQPPEAVAAVCHRHGLEPGKYWLSLGTLEPRKNLPRLLAAWSAALPDLDAGLQLALAGAAGNRNFFAAPGLPQLPARTRLLGHVPEGDLPGLYAGAMAFAYLSLYEGFGKPPLEALACGTPVLASNAASLPEVVGDAALTVDPADTGAITAALIRLAADPNLRARLSAAGRERALQFDWARSAAKTWRVLAAAAGERASC